MHGACRYEHAGIKQDADIANRDVMYISVHLYLNLSHKHADKGKRYKYIAYTAHTSHLGLGAGEPPRLPSLGGRASSSASGKPSALPRLGDLPLAREPAAGPGSLPPFVRTLFTCPGAVLMK